MHPHQGCQRLWRSEGEEEVWVWIHHSWRFSSNGDIDAGLITANITNMGSLYFVTKQGPYLCPQLDFRTPPGFDRTRNAEIGNKDIKFKHLEEAFTSEHWLVRIYKVKKLENREPLDHKPRNVGNSQKYTSKKVERTLVFTFKNKFKTKQQCQPDTSTFKRREEEEERRD